jgi:hypothetical protein
VEIPEAMARIKHPAGQVRELPSKNLKRFRLEHPHKSVENLPIEAAWSFFEISVNEARPEKCDKSLK